MQRVAISPHLAASMPGLMTGAWLARRWYLTLKTRRAYSVRQVSPGDRRLLAELTHALNTQATEREQPALRDLAMIVFDRVIANHEGAVAFVALENTPDGDRAIGVCAYALTGHDGAEFTIAVANSHRGEQVGRTLLSTLVRQAKRVGVRRLTGEMNWANRAMQSLATSLGFQMQPMPSDRNSRLLELEIK